MLTTQERPQSIEQEEQEERRSVTAARSTVNWKKSWKKIAYVIVVAACSFLAFSLFGFKDDRAAFTQAITPERETFVPLENDGRHTCQVGVQM